jgi:hypothetical protein
VVIAQGAIVLFLIAAFANSVLDFFNWFFFVLAQQRLVRRMRESLFASILSQARDTSVCVFVCVFLGGGGTRHGHG